jgi:hypothetical protein
MSNRRLLVLGLVALMLVSPAPAERGWYLSNLKLTSIQMPTNTQRIEPSTSFDFDSNGSTEMVDLTNGHVTVRSREQTHWQSPSSWQVKQTQIADLNNDGLPEIILLVMRPFKPWPVDAWLPNGGRISTFHNSAGMSCHIILIGWNGSSFKERWAGSAMAEPVKAFAVANLASNGKQLLITLESKYDNPPSAPAEKLKVWEWNGFGFTVVSQVSGAFNQLAIARDSNGRLLIIAP